MCTHMYTYTYLYTYLLTFTEKLHQEDKPDNSNSYISGWVGMEGMGTITNQISQSTTFYIDLTFELCFSKNNI